MLRNPNLFLLLLLAHLVADHLEPMVFLKWRKSSSMGTMAHGLVHGLAYAAALGIYANSPWILFWALALGASHYLIDVLKVWVAERVKGQGFLLYLVDQGFHIGLILLASDSGTVTGIPFYVDEIALLVGLLTVSAAGSVAIFEAGRTCSAMWPRFFEEEELRYLTFKERIGGWAERGTAFVLFFLDYYLFVPLAFLPRFAYLFLTNKQITSYHWLDLFLGLAMSYTVAFALKSIM